MNDWKETLFCWKGLLKRKGNPAILTWKGTWVGNEEASTLPSKDDFQASVNTFELESSPVELGPEVEKEDLDLGMLRASSLVGKELSWKGQYKLDNGCGLEDYSDESHICRFTEIKVKGRGKGGEIGEEGGEVIVAKASGDTEFGKFVSYGVLEDVGEGKVQLTLCRRYVSDDDPRYATLK